MMLKPRNRHEMYLAAIGGADITPPEPIPREEMYLANLAGREVDVPNPITPKERAYYNIINDIKFEPENRWQNFVAAANDDSITAPVPITREEIWWSTITLSQEVIVEYSGTLPATLRTVEGYLEDYKIYGNTVNEEGAGVKTENFCGGGESFWHNGYYINSSGNPQSSYGAPEKETYSDYISVVSNQTLTFSYFNGFPAGTSTPWRGVAFYDTARGFISRIAEYSRNSLTVVVPDNAAYCRVTFRTFGMPKLVMLTEGSTPPDTYIPYGYKLPMISRTENFFDYSSTETGYRIQWANGRPYADATAIMSDYIPVTEGDYVLNTGVVVVGYATDKSYVGVYRSDKTWKKQSSELFSAFTVLSSSNVKFVKLMTYDGYGSITNTLMLTEGSTPPNTYIPYHRTDTPIYIGDTQLMQDEYVSYGKQKIYREVGGTLTPTDPPVPLPELPTFTDTNTVIDYEETPAPEEVELKYKTIRETYISADDKVYQDPNGQLLGG